MNTAWLNWTAATLVAAYVSAPLVSFLFPNLEAGIVLFAAGMSWSALTPKVLRLARRLERR
jgi:hypothetical protein